MALRRPIKSLTFQHTAARRRLPVSCRETCRNRMFQHTAARRRLQRLARRCCVVPRFNTQPREGGCRSLILWCRLMPGFQHTAARRRLPDQISAPLKGVMFQHTAARRRLPAQQTLDASKAPVSTHSRAKAAAGRHWLPPINPPSFNTQPREGGCLA